MKLRRREKLWPIVEETLTRGGGLTGCGINMISRDKNPEAFDRGIFIAFVVGVILAGAGAYGCWKFCFAEILQGRGPFSYFQGRNCLPSRDCS